MNIITTVIISEDAIDIAINKDKGEQAWQLAG
jgi:hypothetical protein